MPDVMPVGMQNVLHACEPEVRKEKLIFVLKRWRHDIYAAIFNIWPYAEAGISGGAGSG